MPSTDTLDPPKAQNVSDGKQNKAVKTAIEVMIRNRNAKTERDSKNRRIQDLFELGFEVKEPKGTRKISSKKLYQALWRTANRMKPLDFMIHGTGRPEILEKVVTDGVATVMDQGRYVSSLRDKGGAFQNLLMFGDAFIYVGASPEDGPPIVFNPVDNANVYTDVFATGMRGKGWGRDATKAVAVFSYSWAEFVAMYPKMKNKAGLGRIPREILSEKELFRKQEDINSEEYEDMIEVAHAYDINAKNYIIFAGPSCSIINEFKGDDYPFMLKEEPYIPILHYQCMPSSEGFYNHGIGDMIYDLAILSRRLMNMEIGHVEDNTYPIELVSVPQGEASKFFNKLRLAHEMRAAGKKGFAVLERDPTDPSGAAVQSQSLLTNSLVNEWKLLFDMLDRELNRMGIVLDEVDRGPNVTATQILAEEENANSFVKQIMEYNASESKFAVDLTMDFITEFINPKDDTPLNLTTKLETGEGDMRADGVTLGMVSDELKQHHYFTRINARTGAVPSNTLQQAQVVRVLNNAVPGSPAFSKLMTRFAQLNDIDIPGEEFLPQQQAPAGAAPEVPEEAPASDTGRLTINPRKAEQTEVL